MYKNKEKQLAFQRQWQREQRLKRRSVVLKSMGGKCKKCGYNDSIALQIDHIKPQLALREDRWSGMRLVNRIYRGIISTEGLQLLCANCHSIKTYKEDRKYFGRYNENVFKPNK